MRCCLVPVGSVTNAIIIVQFDQPTPAHHISRLQCQQVKYQLFSFVILMTLLFGAPASLWTNQPPNKLCSMAHITAAVVLLAVTEAVSAANGLSAASKHQLYHSPVL